MGIIIDIYTPCTSILPNAKEVHELQKDLQHPKETLRKGEAYQRVETHRLLRPQEQERGLDSSIDPRQAQKGRQSSVDPSRERPPQIVRRCGPHPPHGPSWSPQGVREK